MSDEILNGSGLVLRDNPQDLIERAVAGNASIEVLEKLLALQERWEERNAKRQFDAAMSRFRELCPPTVAKAHKGHHNNYADLSDVANHVSPHLAECSLSYAWSFPPAEKGKITVRCTLAHVAGHSESAEVTADEGAGKGGQMTWIQALRSTTTYLRRLTLEAVTGVVPADEDDDGNSAMPDRFVGVDRRTPARDVRPPPPAPAFNGTVELDGRAGWKPVESPPVEVKMRVEPRIAPSVQKSLDEIRILIADQDGDLHKIKAEVEAAIVNARSTVELDAIGAAIKKFLDLLEPEDAAGERAELLAKWSKRRGEV